MPDSSTVPSLQTTADIVETRLYDLERRRRATPAQNDEEDCCVTYCKILTANSLTLDAFANNTTALSLSVPILNAGRAIITVNTSWVIGAAGDFWITINPLVGATNYEPLKEYRDQAAGNGDRASVDIASVAYDYGAGTTGFLAVAVTLTNLSDQSVTLRSGELIVELKGRHGSVHCDPATIGQ